MNRFPLITAHTGCMGYLAHSLESLCAALKLGVDVYEDDIRVTVDGVPVLAHDDEVKLSRGRRGSLKELTLEELEADSAAPILLLADVLSWIRTTGKRMNLDIKTADALEPVSVLVKQMKMDDRVFLSGCEYDWAVRANRIGPYLRKLLNVNVDSFRSLSYEDAVSQACEEARTAGCFGLNVPYQAVRPQLLAAARQQSLDVFAWTVAEADDMRRLAQWGVHSITTLDPAKLIAVREGTALAEAE
ncbi:glycerophosphodiester phosphodiesterase [Saccharibacillus brassicae]|uniref:Glycerophosphodiester phosphodiesterase n=1 Tax=Saccharibacillus brassicae TaxID=2583377 RepID=A0A4Y6UV02_SACBS|nr:glycerophosphodiester phosphodiesterase [Saccharibacillus brassicae]QDH20388.1 glycerophosphodiester phosphodiesterase [Saccharibacillus brassicae]